MVPVRGSHARLIMTACFRRRYVAIASTETTIKVIFRIAECSVTCIRMSRDAEGPTLTRDLFRWGFLVDLVRMIVALSLVTVVMPIIIIRRTHVRTVDNGAHQRRVDLQQQVPSMTQRTLRSLTRP